MPLSCKVGIGLSELFPFLNVLSGFYELVRAVPQIPSELEGNFSYNLGILQEQRGKLQRALGSVEDEMETESETLSIMGDCVNVLENENLTDFVATANRMPETAATSFFCGNDEMHAAHLDNAVELILTARYFTSPEAEDPGQNATYKEGLRNAIAKLASIPQLGRNDVESGELPEDGKVEIDRDILEGLLERHRNRDAIQQGLRLSGD